MNGSGRVIVSTNLSSEQRSERVDDSGWQLCDLYENDSIFDKFECCLSGDGQRVATGSYR